MQNHRERENINYQWIKGDNIGIIEKFKESSNGFIIFESGRRINENLLYEFLIEVNDEIDTLDINNIPKVKTAFDIETEAGLKFEKNINNKKNQSGVKNIKSENPIRILLEKQSKNNSVKVEIEFDINIPKKEVIKLLQESFNDNVEEELISFIKDKLNKDEIINKVYTQIEKTIKSYYL